MQSKSKTQSLIVYDDMYADMLSNKKINLIVTEFFIRGKKLSVTVAFITQCNFAVPKNIRLNSTQFIPSQNKLKQKAFNHQLDKNG